MRLVYLLLAVPFVAMIWIGVYHRVEPPIWGIPFFYWFQFVWIIVAAVVTGIAYLCKA